MNKFHQGALLKVILTESEKRLKNPVQKQLIMNISLKLFVSQIYKPRKPLIEEICETFTAINLI